MGRGTAWRARTAQEVGQVWGSDQNSASAIKGNRDFIKKKKNRKVNKLSVKWIIVRQYVYSVHWLNQCIRVVFVFSLSICP
jgi:hypothetical protein